MWIAFKNYYLRDEEQRQRGLIALIGCCELLSKIIIFVTRNNLKRAKEKGNSVVNCFQKLLSSWRGTTNISNTLLFLVLWIAFKNYYLRDEEQHRRRKGKVLESCELLSKIIIFVTRNNKREIFPLVWLVVNCFQKLLSSWRGTTYFWFVNVYYSLWIAFKNYYLRDEEQLTGFNVNLIIGCELLSKIIIFVTRNNDQH